MHLILISLILFKSKNAFGLFTFGCHWHWILGHVTEQIALYKFPIELERFCKRKNTMSNYSLVLTLICLATSFSGGFCNVSVPGRLKSKLLSFSNQEKFIVKWNTSKRKTKNSKNLLRYPNTQVFIDVLCKVHVRKNYISWIFGPNEKLQLCMIEWLGSDFPFTRASFVFDFSKGTFKD